MKYLKNILIIISLVLFVGNYQICEFFHSDSIDDWWNLRKNIYSIIFFNLTLVCFLSLKGTAKSLSCVFLIFCAGDLVDRLFFEIYTFVYSDYILILLSLGIFITQSYRNVQTKYRRERYSNSN